MLRLYWFKLQSTWSVGLPLLYAWLQMYFRKPDTIEAYKKLIAAYNAYSAVFSFFNKAAYRRLLYCIHTDYAIKFISEINPNDLAVLCKIGRLPKDAALNTNRLSLHSALSIFDDVPASYIHQCKLLDLSILCHHWKLDTPEKEDTLIALLKLYQPTTRVYSLAKGLFRNQHVSIRMVKLLMAEFPEAKINVAQHYPVTMDLVKDNVWTVEQLETFYGLTYWTDLERSMIEDMFPRLVQFDKFKNLMFKGMSTSYFIRGLEKFKELIDADEYRKVMYYSHKLFDVDEQFVYKYIICEAGNRLSEDIGHFLAELNDYTAFSYKFWKQYILPHMICSVYAHKNRIIAARGGLGILNREIYITAMRPNKIYVIDGFFSKKGAILKIRTNFAGTPYEAQYINAINECFEQAKLNK